MTQSAVSWGFRLLEINVPHFEDLGAGNPTQPTLAISAKLDWHADPQKSTVVATLKADFEIDGQPLLSSAVACTFELEPIAWESAYDPKHSTIEFPREFLIQLGSITIGTARGILYERSSRHGNSCIVLPLLDVDRLVADAVAIDWGLSTLL